jgi:hypothetical protein
MSFFKNGGQEGRKGPGTSGGRGRGQNIRKGCGG